MNTSTADRSPSNHHVHIPFEGELHSGTFVERLNRFVAKVELQDEIHLAHVPNSGRMSELLVRGAPVGVIARSGPKRKTLWDLVIVKYGDVWVSVDSRQANQIVQRLLDPAMESSAKPPWPGDMWQRLTTDLTGIRREVKVGRHIVDFLLQMGERRAYLEVKSVNLVQEGTALFPDAPTTRGKEHVELLTSFCERGEEAHLLFVVQRSDAKRCSPYVERDPDFAHALGRARRMGVWIGALSCEVSPGGVKVLGSLPVDIP